MAIQMHNKVLGGILLVTGTTIGAGMLALPVSMGFAGAIPSVVLFLGYWLYMTFTAFLFLELSLALPDDANIVTMSKHTLGTIGQVICWILYLFLLYSLTTAYMAGSGPIFLDALDTMTGITLPEWFSPFPLLIVFSLFVYKGARHVDYINRLLMLGLIMTYCVIISWLTPHVHLELIERVDWKAITIGLSVVATSFGFHIIIPTLTSYLDLDINQLKKVIWIGSLIPVVVYILWNTMALGILPLDGANSIAQGFKEGANGAFLIANQIGHTWIGFTARLFAFFAIVTSFLGVSMSLTDFLADGLKVKKTRNGKVLLYALTFLPPIVVTLIDPRAFLTALEYAGAFGVITLLGLLPALMAWSGRYYKHFKLPYQTPGGKLALVLAIVISLVIIAIEIGNKLTG